MTLVDVCSGCGTMFDEDGDSCRRCGADRADAVKRELKDLCYTYTGEVPEDDEIARMVKPIFQPKWGRPQWYEGGMAERPGDDDEEEDGDEGDEGRDDEDGGGEGPSEG